MHSPPEISAPHRRARPHPLALVLVAGLAGLQLLVSVGQPLPPTSGAGPGSVAEASREPVASPAGSQASSSPSKAPNSGASPFPTGGPASPVDPEPAQPTEPVIGVFDAHLDSVRQLYGLPGVSATIVFRDGTRWSGSSGFADIAAATPARPGTPFSVASNSKTFTAALILQLVEQGRLALTDRAAARLSGVPGVAIDPRITVAQLLDHTSGLHDFFSNDDIEPAFAANPDAAWSAAQALSFAGKPLAAPGIRFFYSNTNYVLLGLIAERIGRKPLGALLRERFFEPLGLRTTSYQGLERPFLPVARGYKFSTGSALDPPIALPGSTDIVPFRAAVTASGGAGSIASSAPDIATWARALYDGKVLSPTMTSTMIADAARTSALDPRMPYGYGVNVLPIDGHPSMGHSGRYLGSRAVVRHFPLDGLTISVVTNQSRTDPGLLLVDFLRLALLAQGDDVPGPVAPTPVGTPGPYDGDAIALNARG